MSTDTINADSILRALCCDTNVLLDIYLDLALAYRYTADAVYDLSFVPNFPQRSLDDAIRRMNKAGALVEMTLDALGPKLQFVLAIITITSAPLDVIIALAYENHDLPSRSKLILQLEIIRRLLSYLA